MSMRWRILGAFGLIIIIALGTVALVSRVTTQQEVQSFLGHGGQAGLENLADSLESYYKVNDSWVGVESLFRESPGRGQGPRSGANAFSGDHVLVDIEGIVIYSPSKDEIGTKLDDDTLTRAILLSVSDRKVGYLLPEDGIPDLPENFEELLISRVNQASLLAALISGGVAVLLALILAALILKPVRSLSTAAAKMSQGDLSQRVLIHGKGELSALGETFNHMAESLQESEIQRLTMTADIAHELRNPLAIQRAHLEALQDGVYPINNENLNLVLTQNYQLSRLVDDLRTLALADSGELSLNQQRIDLVILCRDTVSRFEPQARGKNVEIKVNCSLDKIFVYVDKGRLVQVLDNLMQNALRYARENGWIKITITANSDEAIISLHNNGPQMSEQGLKYIFERFYREDKARDRASGGTGLGLAISHKLIEAQGGTMTGANHPVEGVVFRLTLPVIN